MWQWHLQKDGKIKQLTEEQLRKQLRKGKLAGMELVRRSDEARWYPVHESPLYSQEVAFEGSPRDHARLKHVRGFAIHFLSYLAVNVLVGFAAPVFLFWGIGIVLHGARVLPSARELYYEGKLPLLPKPHRALAPPRSALPPAHHGAPAPADPAAARSVTAPQPHVGGAAALPAALPVAEAPTMAGTPDAMAYDPTLGATPTDATPRSIEDRRLHGSVRGKLFGDERAVPISIGRYRLGERVGAGGMGVVYQAHDESLDRSVALKVLRPDIDAEAGMERLQREARAMARLSHPNVVTVFDVGLFEGSVFLAMEFVDGTTLREWLHQARAVGDAVAMVRQAAEGLAAAHDGGLVHRDFKPDNVLVGHDGRVRVLDFGLAKPVDASATQDLLTRTGTVLGTPRYMAPEQLRGEPADAFSDQFSLGVVLYEAIYGVHPYQPEDGTPLPRCVLRGKLRDVPARADVPATLRDAVMKAVAHDPENRHASIRTMLEAMGPPPSSTDEIASTAAAVRRQLARREGDDATKLMRVLDGIEQVVSQLDAKAAVLGQQTGQAEYERVLAERGDAQGRLETASEADRPLLQQQIEALEQRRSGIERAREVLARLRTRRSVAESQLKQLQLDLTREEVGDAPLPDLTGPLQELRFQVDAAQEVEALLESH